MCEIFKCFVLYWNGGDWMLTRCRHVGRLRGFRRVDSGDRYADGRHRWLVISDGLHCRSERQCHCYRFRGFGYQHPRYFSILNGPPFFPAQLVNESCPVFLITTTTTKTKMPCCSWINIKIRPAPFVLNNILFNVLYRRRGQKTNADALISIHVSDLIRQMLANAYTHTRHTWQAEYEIDPIALTRLFLVC